MQHIVLSDDQLKAIAGASAPVEVRDTQGQVVAHLTPLDAFDRESLDRHRKRQGRTEPTIPSEQVQAHLRRLDEIRKSEGLDRAKMLDLLTRMRAGEQV